MTVSEGFASIEDENERVRCLVEQGFTPSLARSVLLARSRDFLPLTIWIVDNSSSMQMRDGRKLMETASPDDVRLETCSRWEELQETVMYHAQLAALLEAPTKFVLLNKPTEVDCPQEMGIAERGSHWIQDDVNEFMTNISKVRPNGLTPLVSHLNNIYNSIQHLENKIVLIIATDGKPTDNNGYSTPSVDREFEEALRRLQSKAWIVLRLCTDEEPVLNYYQKLDDQLELSLEVLDDYLDEAKEVYEHNPWLTYSLCLHRCREMGMSCHSIHRWLDWLDERTLSKTEIFEVLHILGIVQTSKSPHDLSEPTEWENFCALVENEQNSLFLQKDESTGQKLQAFSPWHPMRKRATKWVDIRRLKRHGKKFPMAQVCAVVFVAVVVQLFKALFAQNK